MPVPPTPQAIVDLLSRSTLFRDVSAELLGKLAPHVEVQAIGASQPILVAGRPVTAIHFLFSGRASLRSADGIGGPGVLLDDLGPGEALGVEALALGGPAALGVVAEEPCEVLVVQRAHFDRLAQGVPAVNRALAAQLADRLVRVAAAATRQAVPEAALGAAPPAIPFVELAQYTITPQLLDLLPQRVVLEHRLLPLEVREQTLVVGMVMPTSHIARAEVRRSLQGYQPEFVAVSSDDFAQALVRLKLDVRERPAAGAGGKLPKPVYQVEIKKEADRHLQMIGDDAVQMLDRILTEAVERGASDVHIEPEANSVRVRFRQNGLLQDRREPVGAHLATPLVGRIKVLAELDITERRIPQDGRLVVRFGSRELSVRVSTMPVARGEKAVLRILDPAEVMRPMEQIFVDPRQQELVGRAVSAAWGAIVVFGATGSGKTSTLYSLLNYRRKIRPDHSIVTVEDPVEFVLPGITQSGVNSRAGLEYSTALRGLLRQDPDAILIGEVRDQETASVLVEAGTTGHLLFASAHASNLPSAFERFHSLGIPRARLVQVSELFVVQRLVRRLCPSCTRDEEVPAQLFEALGKRGLLPRGATARLPKAGACEACQHTGYRGRVAVAEVLAVDERVRNAIVAEMPIDEFTRAMQAAGQYVTRADCARLQLSKRLITPFDALAAAS
ncbi:MAG: ATPase, T2SS/T4P/T4SS family [Pseudomonadota bacterium]|nr:ATPase, T2SS/T4P/T4SS family [Pseudomonadota bacterium]